MNRIHQTIIVLLLLGATACFDDPVELTVYGSIEGTITDLSTDLPLAGVNVTTNPISKTINTDETGTFRFDSLPVDNYSLRFRKDGYEAEMMVADLNEVSTIALEVFMSPDYTSNLPPGLPTAIQPSEGAEIQDLGIWLQWSAVDPNPKDSLLYDLYIFKGNEAGGQQVLNQSPQDSFYLEGLQFGTTYSWQVVVTDQVNEPVFGPVWQFRVRQRPNMPILFVREAAHHFQVWMSSTEGESNRLYESFSTAWRPKRSPLGDRIAFLSFVGTEAHIFVSDPLGENIQQVTTVAVGGYDLDLVTFSWSPDGDRLLYPAFEQLYIVNVDGTGLVALAQAPPGMIFEGVDWSRFNDRIVARVQGDLPYENQLYEVGYPDGQLNMLVDDLPGTIGNPALSVDGQQLLYALDLSGLEVSSGRQNNASVILQTIGTSDAPQNISAKKPAGYNDLEPQFSPTEAEIIVTEWINTEAQNPNMVSIALDDLDKRTVIVVDARTTDWQE